MHSWISLAYGVLSMPRAYIYLSKRDELVVACAHGRCEYCQSVVEYATQSFDIDHIVPVSRGRTSTVDNLAYACSGCNSHKFNRLTALDPVGGANVALFRSASTALARPFRLASRTSGAASRVSRVGPCCSRYHPTQSSPAWRQKLAAGCPGQLQVDMQPADLDVPNS